MSTDNAHLEDTYLAGADLTDKLYYAVKLSAANTVVVCSSQGEDGEGVLYSEASATGRGVAVAYAGMVKGIAGGTITAGAKVTVGTTGKFEAAASGDYEWGTAVEGAASGDIFKIRLGSKNITA